MTAIVGTINRRGVAFAADSAATHTISSRHKITNHANKIFELSKYNPVGAAICGNLDFLGMPWEDIFKIYRKRLLNYILCIRFFIEVHSIVSASRFFHMPTYLRVVIECQSRFFPFFPAFSRNCPDYFLHTSGSSSFRSLSDLGAR